MFSLIATFPELDPKRSGKITTKDTQYDTPKAGEEGKEKGGKERKGKIKIGV